MARVVSFAILIVIAAAILCIVNPLSWKRHLWSRKEPLKEAALTPGIIWLHIPKTGSQLATTIAHAICGDAVEKSLVFGTGAKDYSSGAQDPDKYLPRKRGVKHGCRFNGRKYGRRELHRCTTARWNTVCGAGKFISFQSGHMPLGAPEGHRASRKGGAFVAYGRAWGT
eukprot:879609-Amphidinium_carterae.1